MNRTGLLFAMPSFFRGFGKAIDLGSTRNIYNESDTPEKADYNALRSDWEKTGEDIRKATEGYHGKIKRSIRSSK